MFIWALAAALLEAAAASSDLASRREGGASAVLSADGHVANGKEAVTPMCAEACDDYQQGVDQTSTAVCIDMFRTCAPAGCGMDLCHQRFNDECSDHCSEWADVTIDSLNVCQHKTDLYRCSGQKSCPSDTYRCKQKKIPQCFIFCEGYEFSGQHSVSQDTDLVCMNNDANSANMGTCMPLPCSMSHHNSELYEVSNVCHQSFPYCANKCADGSEELWQNSTTMCFDEYSEKCVNHHNCGEISQTRCIPTKVHQDLSKVDLEDDGWGLVQRGQSEKDEVPKWTAGMTQAQWTKEQQRARIAKLRRVQRQRQQEQKPAYPKIIRRDIEAAK